MGGRWKEKNHVELKINMRIVSKKRAFGFSSIGISTELFCERLVC
jgi:hypothetical protein